MDQKIVLREDDSRDMMKFFADSWFWVPDPHPLGFDNDPKLQVIATNVIHSLDAFLSGCGWVVNMKATRNRPQLVSCFKRRGIVLVEEGERLQIVEKLEAFEQDLNDRIPIFIFNLTTFARDVRQEGDVSRMFTTVIS